ncbi:Uncharacterized protein ChrSV_3782 [Chromobacterium vaccinii]|nr:Uncharacterized protein ChrSW_3782 [Chromobacterium vaccinii]QND91239.1 Uncharacterized protein ChrSV_3782 [Chromobacterium vaccinii]
MCCFKRIFGLGKNIVYEKSAVEIRTLIIFSWSGDMQIGA